MKISNIFKRKITLDTLTKATEQEVFDQCAKHLLKQNKKCSNGAHCMYRYKKLKCAAGCLISDKEYNKEMEGKSWKVLDRRGLVPSKHVKLIMDLQKIHDHFSTEEWKIELSKLAMIYNLNTKILG